MNEDKRKYHFRIEPLNGRVYAEIFKHSKGLIFGKPMELSVIKKDFGKWYRGVRAQDYVDARRWIDTQLRLIHEANKQS